MVLAQKKTPESHIDQWNLIGDADIILHTKRYLIFEKDDRSIRQEKKEHLHFPTGWLHVAESK